MEELLREKFLRTYANIPLNLREQTILLFEEKPITWNVAYLEVKTNTEKSKEILKDLAQLELI
jgi:hypothetical protein